MGCIVSWIIGIALSPIFIPILIISILISKYKKHAGKPKVVWGPIPIINIKYNSNGLRKLGYVSDTIVYNLYDINTRSDFDYVIKIFKNVKLHFLSLYILSYPVFIYVLLKYDIFQFYFNGGFLSQTPFKWFELQLLKTAGKKIVVSPYGGDVIQPSIVKKHKWNISQVYNQDYDPVDEVAVLKRVNYFTKYADIVIGVGELMDYIPRYDVIIPMNSTIDLNMWKVVTNSPHDTVCIVHAPNHRSIKGTKYLVTACDELKTEGYNIKLVLVENMLNIDAKRIYECADIIADQFILGWYALFAAEGMALGKPVLCYLRNDLIEINKSIISGCPIINTNPDNLKNNLKMLIEDEKLRIKLSSQGRKYVRTYGVSYVGNQLDKIYTKLWM